MPLSTWISPQVDGAGRVMITNGGPHPPDFWAQATAEHIAPIAPTMTGSRRLDALALQARIQGALTPHHDAVQQAERAAIAADPNRLMAGYDPEQHVDEALAAVVAASVGTEWEAHFHDPAVVDVIRREIGAHFATAQHIERSWHADRNPTLPAAVAFRAQHHPVGAPAQEG